MDIINQEVKSFIQAVGRREKSLSEISKLMDHKKASNHAWRINKLLSSNFLIDSRKEGRDIMLKLNKNGLYYLDLFDRLDKR